MTDDATSPRLAAQSPAGTRHAAATQDTVTQLIAAIRRVIREVPGAAQVAAICCTAHDYADPGKPRIAWNDEQARPVLVDALVGDAIRLLADLPEQPSGDKAANAVGVLALVAGQDVEPAEDSDGRDGRWRIAQRTAPDRMVSTVESRVPACAKDRTHRQDGFKAHLTIEPETGLFTWETASSRVASRSRRSTPVLSVQVPRKPSPRSETDPSRPTRADRPGRGTANRGGAEGVPAHQVVATDWEDLAERARGEGGPVPGEEVDREPGKRDLPAPGPGLRTGLDRDVPVDLDGDSEHP